MAKILLHAGTHKTGTTTLQAVLAAHRPELAARGIYYPDIRDFFPVNREVQSANAHFAMASAVASPDAADSARLAAFIGHLREVEGRFDRIVLSAESMYRLTLDSTPEAGKTGRRRGHRLYVKRLAEVFADFDAEVVLYFRRVDRFAESLYAETVVSSDMALPFPDYLKTGAYRFDYRFQIDLFSRHFPLRIYGFEEKVRAGLVDSFFRDNGLGPAFAGQSLRSSIPPLAVLWLCRFKAEKRPSQRERRRRWLFALQPEAAELFGAGSPASFWPDIAARDAFIARYQDNVPEIAFPAAGPDMPPTGEWTQPMHRRANRAFAHWQKENLDWLCAREAARKQPFIP